ncbi:hypothetical protein GF312_15845 [Candidatus Poribacteria bacterium]|nr:hypothetical protein [Candidatus Poribacteria bacterium]
MVFRLMMFLIIMSISFLFSIPIQAVSKMKISDCEDVSLWDGAVSESERVKEGEGSVKWIHSQSDSVSISQIPHDWSGYNHLAFWLYSKVKTDSRFMLILWSENEKTEGIDYYSMRIRLDFTGWREFKIPFQEMGVARSPLGWDQIQRLTFTASGWGNQPHPDAVVIIDHIEISKEEPMKGPRMTDQEFFDSLNLDYPGMEKVKEAVSKNDLESAKHEFVNHLRTREKPRWHFDWQERPDASENADTEAADRILEHELSSVGVPHKFEGEIDWTLNPINYREWPWQLNRHPFWVTLGRTYWKTGDEKYAKEFVYQMTHWVENCPVPTMNSGNSSATWRTIEAGIRTSGSWMHAFHYFLSSPSFTHEAVITMVKSFVEHARHLMRWPTGGNWLTMESNGLFHIGTMFPEFKEAEEWRESAIERMYAELDKQVYPDGAQIELTTGYHQVSLRNFVGLMELAKLNEIDMPDDYLDKLEHMYHYNLYASMPNGRLPGLNDGSELSIRRSMREGFRYFSHRKDFQWSATNGKEGEKPTEISYTFPYAGQFIMRSGWEEDDRYMLIDGGPFGYGHQHEDKLSIVLYAHGKVHITDPGNYPYDSSQWRRYVISTYAHNTIMVDGQPQNRRRLPRETFVVKEPLPNKWITNDDYDYFSGVYEDGYGKDGNVQVIHKRCIFFAKPDYWIIIDILKPSDDTKHKYESMFHLEAADAVIETDTNRVDTQNPDTSNLSIIPPEDDNISVEIVSGQEEPVVQGWLPAGGYKVRPVPTPIFTKSGEGVVWYIYLFYPTAESVECPVKSVELQDIKGNAEARCIKITFTDNREHIFIQSDEPGEKLEFSGYSTDSEAMLIKIKTDGSLDKKLQIN